MCAAVMKPVLLFDGCGSLCDAVTVAVTYCWNEYRGGSATCADAPAAIWSGGFEQGKQLPGTSGTGVIVVCTAIPFAVTGPALAAAMTTLVSPQLTKSGDRSE